MNKKIFRNSSYLMVAQAIIKIVSFFYTIFLARNLGVDNFGLFTVALSYFALVSSIADLGISRYLIREIAKDKTVTSNLALNVLVLRLFSICLMVIPLGLLLLTFDSDQQRVSLTLLALGAALFNGLALTLDTVFIALEKTLFSALGLIFLSLITTILGVVAINMGWGTTGAIQALLLGQASYFIFLFYLLYKRKIYLRGKINFKLIKEIARGSLPYGLIAVLGFLYFRIDTILLSYIRGDFETGIYGAAFKFLEAVIFIPSSIAAVLFPVLSRLHQEDHLEIKKIYFQSLKILGLISIVLLLGFLFILPEVINLLLPQYTQSIQAIRILSFTIPFMFIHIPGAMVLLSTDRYLKPIVFLSIFTLSFNIIANLLFIPKYGYIGASYITVFSEMLSFVVFFILLKVKVLK